MAELEDHAFRRDKRFLVRLVLGLTLAMSGGLYIYSKITGRHNAEKAADILLGGDAAQNEQDAQGASRSSKTE